MKVIVPIEKIEQHAESLLTCGLSCKFVGISAGNYTTPYVGPYNLLPSCLFPITRDIGG